MSNHIFFCFPHFLSIYLSIYGSFVLIMMLSDDEVNQWFRMHGPLATTISCNTEGCQGRMVLKSSSRGAGGCTVNRLHTRACRDNSIFEKKQLDISRHHPVHKELLGWFFSQSMCQIFRGCLQIYRC